MTSVTTPSQIVNRPIHRWEGGQGGSTTDQVINETLLSLSVNGFPAYQLLCLPGLEVELCLGFLLTSGAIEATDEVQELRLLPPDPDGGRFFAQVQVRLRKIFQTKQDLIGNMAAAVLRGAPQAAEPLIAQQFQAFPPQEARLPLPNLLALMASLPERQRLFQQTGGTHAIFLAEAASSEIILGAEDVGRHNAFDKVIGQALQKNLPTNAAVALLSGRASFEMVLKAARAGIPLLASVSAPTSLAIRLAELQGLTLVGFARQGRCNIYSHPHRLLGASAP